MNSEKEFKDALKSKLGEKQFQFDEASWEQASQMLDATRDEKKKRPFPYLILSGVLLLVSVIGFYVFKLDTAVSVKEIVATNTDVKINNTNVNEIASTQTTSAENSDVILNEKTANVEVKNETVKPINENVEKTNSENKKVEVLKNKQKAITGSANNKIKKEMKAHINSVIAVTGKTEQNSISENTKTQSPKENNPVEKESSDTKTEATLAIETKATLIEEIKADQLVSTISMLPVNMIPVKEPVAFIEVPQNDFLPKDIVKEPVHFISFEAGANYLFGWNNPGKKDANGINPVIGLNYSNVSKPITFSFGIHYTMVRNLSYSSHSVTTTRYNFGEESDVMVFTPTTMHYLVAPIRISYSIDPKNVFGLGYNVGYLFNLNSNVELYGQKSGQKGNSTILKTSGYTQGFKTIDSQLSVFYRRNLSKDLWLNAEFIYGLTDIKDNKFFNSNVYERNMGVKLTLIYNLFKK